MIEVYHAEVLVSAVLKVLIDINLLELFLERVGCNGDSQFSMKKLVNF